MHDAASDKPPRLSFSRGRAAPAGAPSGRSKHVPIEDVLAKMAGKVGERRRAAESARRGEGSEPEDRF